MSRSTAALLIAIMFHLLLILLFDFLMKLRPEHHDKPQEHRIKVALKEKPKTSKKSAAVDNKKKIPEKAPPMPKGKQLEKLPSETVKQNKIEKKRAKPAQEKQVAKAIETPEPVVKNKKPAYKHVEKVVSKDINISTKPKNKSGLYAILSKKQKTQPKDKSKSQTGTRIGNDFKEAYGEAFGKLSEGEKKYIVDNQEVMRRITQEQLNRLAPVNIPRNLAITTSNIIEFYLHPNGDISDLRLITASGSEILDDTSLQTIEYSYHRYPLPKQKTMVRYKVGYYLAGSRRR